MKISKKWRKMQKIYQLFIHEEAGLDDSEDAAMEMYIYESTGKGNLGKSLFDCTNAYWVAKHSLNLTVAMWKEGLREGILVLSEIYDGFDKDHHWWLNNALREEIEELSDNPYKYLYAALT